MADRRRVVILGGGFGGLAVAQRLSRAAKGSLEIVLVDAATVHTFTPWLYEVASGNPGTLREADRALAHSACVPFQKILAGTDVRFRRAEVTGCDLVGKHVVLAGGHTLAYDVLVVALGAQAAYFGIPGMREHAYAFKTTDNANAIRVRLAQLLEEVQAGTRKRAHVVVVGAGPSGCELVAEFAGDLRRLRAHGVRAAGAIRVTLIDGGNRILPLCSERLSRASAERLRQLDIALACDTMVTDAHADRMTVKPRRNDHGATASPYADGECVPCDMLVWCGGITPHEILAQFPLLKEPKGRVRTTMTGEVREFPNVFVVGDAAYVQDIRSQAVLPQTAQAAMRVARRVADNVLRVCQDRVPRPLRIPRRWPFVITLGGKWGVAEVGPVFVKGYLAYVLRRAADLEYFLRILPLRDALRTWGAGVCMYRENDE